MPQHQPENPDDPTEPAEPATAARGKNTAQPDAGDAPPAVRLHDARASLGARPVLRGVDLTVAPGEVVALLGANGSGKSTAIRAIVGQVPLTGGSVELFGTPLRRFRDWGRIGYVPQRSTASGGVPATVREVVSAGRLSRTGLRPLGAQDRRAVEGALERVGMADRAGDSVEGLSGGQYQRVLIARALAGEPDLLIMDEPLAGVDLASQRVLAEVLREQVAAGTAVLLVLHELGPLAPLIDRSVQLADGRVAQVYGREDSAGLVHDPACHPHPAAEPGGTDTDWTTGLLR
ncbi:metal ABC transporter ATP-binding protein [Streptomyces polyrhachis]|uniref:Metal ABC transporter ATP-binding protein n=1 Tax=Streptomyces polyrhachis TaxID=1282885 RepID=A0ABW2GIB9_9ACTN